MRFKIFSVDKFSRQCEILLIAASFTSASLSDNSKVKVYIKLLSVISLPNDLAKSAKFFAKARRTFHDLSSPAASSVPNV